MRTSRLLFASLVFSTAACQSAHADRVAGRRAPVPSPVIAPAQAPYGVTIVGEDGRELDTYTHGRRFYVHGQTGERYSIRVNNPTSRRVEAVVSVDGLDVIDGESANFRSKRGYIVPAWGSVTIDGFRTSTQSVAAFRFSSVSSSYAGRKGKARNVGVIGVAVFEEKAQPTLIVPRKDREFDGRRDARGNVGNKSRRPAPPRSAPRPAPDWDITDDMAPSPGDSTGLAESSSSASRPTRSIRPRERRQERPGLGTEFGENRSSSVRFTQFVRANQSKPTSVAELRYNDGQGLQALGIRLRTSVLVDDDELAIRESASPFPESPDYRGFAKPPR